MLGIPFDLFVESLVVAFVPVHLQRVVVVGTNQGFVVASLLVVLDPLVGMRFAHLEPLVDPCSSCLERAAPPKFFIAPAN